jgi:hypothetical protein
MVKSRTWIPPLLLAGAVAASGCATARRGPPARQVSQLPAAAELPEDGAARADLAAAQAHEAKADAAAAADDARGEWGLAAAGYAGVAEQSAAAGWRVPLRHRAAELYLKAQRWDQASELSQAVIGDPQASEASRAAGARLAATAALGAANAAVKAGQLEKLDLGPERKDGPRPPAAPWRRFLEATDAYLARAGADPSPPPERGPSAAELALAAAEVQYAHGEIEDARRRLEAVLDPGAAHAELLDEAVALYLATFLVRGDHAGHAAAVDRLRQRIEAEAARAPARKAELAKVLDELARASAAARFSEGEDLLRRGQAGDAARAFEAAAAYGAADAANALHNAAVAWDQAGEAGKAAAVREGLLRDHPEAAVTAEDALRLAAFRARQGDHLAAARLYEDFLRRWPGSPSRCLALRNVASELDRAERAGEAAARYLAFGKDAGCAKADPNIAARALVRAGRLSEGLARAAYGAAAELEGVSDVEAKGQVTDAKRRLKGL